MAGRENKTQTVDKAEEQTKTITQVAVKAADSKSVQETKKSMDETEKKLFKSCEETIGAGVRSCFQMGQALQTILEKELYRQDYTNFDVYCEQRWGFSGSHARRKIDEVKVGAKLEAEYSPTEGEKILPTNEAQARPLARLKPDQWVSTWKQVVEKSQEDDHTITGEYVEAIVSSLIGKGSKSKSSSKKAASDKKDVASKILGFVTQLRKQLGNSVTEDVKKLLNQLRKLVREELE